MKHLKKLTLLHSNDMHGDFEAEAKDGKLLGGISFTGMRRGRGTRSYPVRGRSGRRFCSARC